MKSSLVLFLMLLFSATHVFAQEEPPAPQVPEEAPGQETPQQEAPEEGTENFEGTMTLEKMNEIITAIDENATRPSDAAWQFKLVGIPLMVVTDQKNDRMRVMVPIRKAEEMTKEELMRIAQANFDSALDARYAVANGLLWAVYIHPLRALYDRQFISALAQTATTAATYGKTYSSGAFVFGGGDSQGILRDQILEALKDKGLEV